MVATSARSLTALLYSIVAGMAPHDLHLAADETDRRRSQGGEERRVMLLRFLDCLSVYPLCPFDCISA
jgi:hypothetical protein